MRRFAPSTMPEARASIPAQSEQAVNRARALDMRFIELKQGVLQRRLFFFLHHDKRTHAYAFRRYAQ